jgi:uncharacterized membrane protein
LAEEDESGKRSRYGVDRVLALSDGVFAFAITLLVLDLAVPALSAAASSADLWQALSEEWVSFLSYLTSFFIAGVWWNAHNRNFQYLRDADSTLRWLNLVFLLWIALLPFFTKILDQYNTLQIAVVLYAIDQTLAGVFMGLSWWYASRNHRLVDRNLEEGVIRSRLLSNIFAPVFFIISIGISFVSPVVATYSWFAMLPVFVLMHRLTRESARK